jgi:hypothetical protein
MSDRQIAVIPPLAFDVDDRREPDWAKPYQDMQHQAAEWKRLGMRWATRNPQTAEETDETWRKGYGIPKTELVRMFLGDMPADMSWLEVGCGGGGHMRTMAAAGWGNIRGIDVSTDAITLAPAGMAEYGDAADLPFEDKSFQGITTSGTLMAMVPEERLRIVLREMDRVATSVLFVCETWQPVPRMLEYGGGELLPAAILRPWGETLAIWLQPMGWTMIRQQLYLGAPPYTVTPMSVSLLLRLPRITETNAEGVWKL